MEVRWVNLERRSFRSYVRQRSRLSTSIAVAPCHANTRSPLLVALSHSSIESTWGLLDGFPVATVETATMKRFSKRSSARRMLLAGCVCAHGEEAWSYGYDTGEYRRWRLS